MKNAKKHNVEVVLLLTLAIILMVATGAAAQSCSKKGEGCSATQLCCERLDCDGLGTCQDCPAQGEACDLFRPCCGGYKCSGILIFGKCNRD